MAAPEANPKGLRERLNQYVRYSELKHLGYNIAALQQQKKFRSLAVLSYFPGEGKTLCSAALAMAYQETCHTKVLIVDTTTLRNKHSIAIKDCFNGSLSAIHVTSLDELRLGTNGFAHASAPMLSEKGPVLETEVVRQNDIQPPHLPGNDFSLIKRVAEEGPKQYGLVLLDTAPIHARNQGNVDPLLVARLADASVLVVSREFLDSPNVSASLKAFEDPLLHLIGIISNEQRAS